jgi:hypothetical protein
MGGHFDPAAEAARNLREFSKYAPYHESQMQDVLVAFLHNAGIA